VELYQADGAEVLASYDHPHLGRAAAVTTRPAGVGRVTVVGTVPDQELGAALARWLVPDPVAGWEPPASVTVASASRPDGRRLHVVHNWSWEPVSVPAPAGLRDLLDDSPGGSVAAGSPVGLGPWDVRVLADLP
jgi:beta-galactosidase